MDGFELTKLCIQFDFGRSNAVAKSVLVALASHYNVDNGKVWPGSDVLCREAACQRNALFNAIKWLRECGLIETKRTWIGNVYTFNFQLLAQGGFEPRTEFNTKQSIENVTTVSIENITKLSNESDTCLSIESDTQTNKEQIKETKITNSDFSDSLDNSIVDCTSPWEDRQRAIEEHNRRMRAAIASAELQPTHRHSIEYF